MAKNILRMVKTFVIILLILLAALFIVLCVTEYRPKAVERLTVDAAKPEARAEGAAPVLHGGDELRIMSWNMGYGALGDTADFFMDGGSHVVTADADGVKENVEGVIREVQSESPDILFLQEADRNSTRSHHVNEVKTIQDAFPEYDATFASNFKTAYVPYPWPPIGKVDSGLLTLSRYSVTDSTRVKLANPFKWPIRICNLKRCLMVDRIPIEGSKRELVVINLHLEAYDSGEGKIAQTRKLLKVLDEERAKGNYVIAGGDFNQTFSNVDSNMYPVDKNLWVPGVIDAKDFGKSWSLRMDNRVPTCRSLDQAYQGKDPKKFHFYMIDGFIVSDNVDVRSLETKDLQFRHTDHNPVVMELQLER